MENCIFCKIVRGQIPKEFEYQDENIVVFKDIHPQAPVHLLIVPREHVNDFNDVSNPETLKAIYSGIKKIIEEKNLMGKGYRVEVNGGGAQIVPHLHFHLMSPIKPPKV